MGDTDPALRPIVPERVDTCDLWLVMHAEMRKAPRVRVAMDFVTDVFAQEIDLVEGRRPKPAAARLTPPLTPRPRPRPC